MQSEVDAIINDNIGPLTELIIGIYHKHFTADEIKEMIGFYATPLGQKSIRVMPALMMRFTASSQLAIDWSDEMVSSALSFVPIIRWM